MAGNPAAFGFMYKVEMGPGSTFTVVDGDADSTNGLTPAASDVIIKDDIQDGPRERHSVVGDVANDHFHVTAGRRARTARTPSRSSPRSTRRTGSSRRTRRRATTSYFTNDQLDDCAGRPAPRHDGRRPPGLLHARDDDPHADRRRRRRELLASGDLVIDRRRPRGPGALDRTADGCPALRRRAAHADPRQGRRARRQCAEPRPARLAGSRALRRRRAHPRRARWSTEPRSSARRTCRRSSPTTMSRSTTIR